MTLQYWRTGVWSLELLSLEWRYGEYMISGFELDGKGSAHSQTDESETRFLMDLRICSSLDIVLNIHGLPTCLSSDKTPALHALIRISFSLFHENISASTWC